MTFPLLFIYSRGEIWCLPVPRAGRASLAPHGPQKFDCGNSESPQTLTIAPVLPSATYKAHISGPPAWSSNAAVTSGPPPSSESSGQGYALIFLSQFVALALSPSTMYCGHADIPLPHPSCREGTQALEEVNPEPACFQPNGLIKPPSRAITAKPTVPGNALLSYTLLKCDAQDGTQYFKVQSHSHCSG